MRYCITHENWSNPEMFDYIPDECIFTSCPPPVDMDNDGWEWTMSLPEPSEDELLLMDMAAEVLEADFIGELS